LLIDHWVDQGATEWSASLPLLAQQKYNLEMDYYENGGGAVAMLSWSSPSTAKAIIPQTQLYTTSNLPPVVTLLRQWDYATAARVDHFVANSPNVAARIAKYYRRESVYIPPPIDTAAYSIAPKIGDYFLAGGRLIPYKRVDLAIEACNQLRLPLRVFGGGRDEQRLRRLAGPTIQFLGRLSNAEMRVQMAACRAFIFPGDEEMFFDA